MDIKELNKSQLILLAILLSFITSIATGIVTVTLMQQAPSSVIMPINRVVRETVEKIVPGSTTNTTHTVVVKEEDLVVDAIEKNKSSVFSITKEYVGLDGIISEASLGRGLIISDEGYLAIDSMSAYGNEVFYVKNNIGKFKASFVLSDKSGFSILKIGAQLDEKNKLSFTLPTFGDINKMKAGQKIIVMGDSISSFIFDGSYDM
ncbi:MAG: S1C family serine protease, partial [Candidatus Paceibacterota bacterium]